MCKNMKSVIEKYLKEKNYILDNDRIAKIETNIIYADVPLEEKVLGVDISTTSVLITTYQYKEVEFVHGTESFNELLQYVGNIGKEEI